MSAKAVLLLITLHSSLITSVACDKSAQSKEEKVRDTQPPTIEIVEPNVPYGVEGISVKESTIKLSGSSEDDRRVIKVKWESSRGGKGVAHTTFRGTQTDWEVPEVKLEEGDNRITVTALDPHANAATKTIWIVRNTQIEFISFPDASETDIRLSEATEVIFRMAIQESAKVKIESVKLVKVNENNETLDTLGTMFDDGKKEHGDEVPADGVYTAKVTLLEGTEGKVRFRVIVSAVREGVGPVSASSEPFYALIFRKWTSEEWQHFYAVEKQVHQLYEELSGQLGRAEAIRRTVEWLKKQPGVKGAGGSEDGFGFVMESGIELIVTDLKRSSKWRETDGEAFEPSSTESEPDDESLPTVNRKARRLAPLRYKISSKDKPSRAQLPNPRVLTVSPFSDERRLWLPPGAYDKTHALFERHKCPAFESKRIKGVNKVGINLLKTMKEYSVVILDTHGEATCGRAGGWHETCPKGVLEVAGATVVTLTGTPVSERNDQTYSEDLQAGNLRKVFDLDGPVYYYAFSPGFVRKYNRGFPPGSMIFNGSCRGLFNSTMADAFMAGGVSTYLGYTEIVNTCYDKLAVVEIFTSLLGSRSVGSAYSDFVSVRGPTDATCSPRPEPIPAKLVLAGSPDLKITIEGFNNGSFENGTTPSGWDVKGDVRVITKLGTITAKDGNWMAFLTTGEKSENEVGSTLSQPFCVPANVNKVTFDYRLVSEEPLEFVNSAWRDTFEASLDVAGAKTVLVAENTDKGPWSPLSGVNFEGGDHTAFATDWKRISSDLPESARKEGATLAFLIRDGGDYIYDTSVLIDGVRME